jgi:hypothetical protein
MRPIERAALGVAAAVAVWAAICCGMYLWAHAGESVRDLFAFVGLMAALVVGAAAVALGRRP